MTWSYRDNLWHLWILKPEIPWRLSLLAEERGCNVKGTNCWWLQTSPLKSRLLDCFCSSPPGLWFLRTGKPYFTLQVFWWLKHSAISVHFCTVYKALPHSPVTLISALSFFPVSLSPAAALTEVTHSFLLASKFHVYFASYVWLWLWLLWLIPGLCSSRAHEPSIAPHCSTCLLMGKNNAKSGRISLFPSFVSLYVFHILLREKEQRLPLENIRRWVETIPKSTPGI